MSIRSRTWVRTWTAVLGVYRNMARLPGGQSGRTTAADRDWPEYGQCLLGAGGKADLGQSSGSPQAAGHRSQLRSLFRRLDATQQALARGQEPGGHRAGGQVPAEPAAQSAGTSPGSGSRQGDRRPEPGRHGAGLCRSLRGGNSGHGRRQRVVPFLVARVSDEADLLDAKFKTQIDSRPLSSATARSTTRFSAGTENVLVRREHAPSPAGQRSRPAQSPVQAAVAGPAARDRWNPCRGHTGWKPVSAGSSTRATAKAKALIQRGLDAYHAGQNDAALSALSEAIRLDPRNADIHVDRGNVWYVQQEYKQAITDFSEAIRLDPGCATAYGNRAFALNTLGDKDKAITDFNAAIRLQANFGRAYNGAARAFQAKGMLDTAIADFDEAIRLEPEPRRGLRKSQCGPRQEGQQGPGRCRRGQGESTAGRQGESRRLDHCLGQGPGQVS